MATPETAKKKNILDLFIDGARNGFTIGTTSLLPNVIMRSSSSAFSMSQASCTSSA